MTGDVLGSEERGDGSDAVQGVKQAGAALQVLQHSFSPYSSYGIVDIARTSQVVPMEGLITQGFNRSISPTNADPVSSSGDLFFDERGW